MRCRQPVFRQKPRPYLNNEKVELSPSEACFAELSFLRGGSRRLEIARSQTFFVGYEMPGSVKLWNFCNVDCARIIDGWIIGKFKFRSLFPAADKGCLVGFCIF